MLIAVFGKLVFGGVFLATLSAYGEMMILNKPATGTEVRVKTGDLIRVELEESGATGYLWEIKHVDLESVTVLGSRTEDARPSSPIMGGAILKIWELRAEKKGETRIHFIYYRPWEGKEKASKELIIKVTIE